MNEFFIPFIVPAACVLLLVLFFAALALRRFQLRSALGTFDASVCLLPEDSWQAGVCRYGDKHLEWLRMFSLSPRPRVRFRRSSLVLSGWRQPTGSERNRIPRGAVVVMMDYEGARLLMAMQFEAYAGLSSWIEAGPVIGVGTWR